MSERVAETAERLAIEGAQRDPSKFAALYDSNFERVYAFIVRLVRDREEAEHVTSDVFHHALANLERYEWQRASFAGWLFEIAANTVADRSRRAAKEGAPHATDDGAAAASSEETEARARLFRLVDRLLVDERRVISMRFADEKPIREIARELGRSESAVKELQFRGLQSLRAGSRATDA